MQAGNAAVKLVAKALRDYYTVEFVAAAALSCEVCVRVDAPSMRGSAGSTRVKRVSTLGPIWISPQLSDYRPVRPGLGATGDLLRVKETTSGVLICPGLRYPFGPGRLSRVGLRPMHQTEEYQERPTGSWRERKLISLTFPSKRMPRPFNVLIIRVVLRPIKRNVMAG